MDLKLATFTLWSAYISNCFLGKSDAVYLFSFLLACWLNIYVVLDLSTLHKQYLSKSNHSAAPHLGYNWPESILVYVTYLDAGLCESQVPCKPLLSTIIGTYLQIWMESSKKGKYIEYVSKPLCGSLAVYCLLFNNCIFPNRYCSVLTESMDSR